MYIVYVWNDGRLRILDLSGVGCEQRNEKSMESWLPIDPGKK